MNIYSLESLANAFQNANLSKKDIRSLAKQTGFSKRNSGKMDAFDFFLHVCRLSTTGSVSYNDLASSLELHTPSDVSRQACAQRMTPQAAALFERVLEHLLRQRSAFSLLDQNITSPFSRVLVQDSTLISLPAKLFSEFSGVANAHAKKVHARIQCVTDLCTGRFLYFSIDPYSRPDLSVAIETHTQPRDLLLRDRGYFRLESFASQSIQQSFFIQRYKHKTLLLDSPEAKDPIDLLRVLQEKGSLDQIVYFPKLQGIPFRLVAFPVPEEIANLRRMKAKKEYPGHNPSKEVLALMSYTIYITNLLDPSFTPDCMARLYGLRWRIESIFKTFKSNLGFEKCHTVSSTQLRSLLLARFCVVCLYYHQVFAPLWSIVKNKTDRHLSLMKMMRYLQIHPEALSRFQGKLTDKTLRALVRYCCYDKRKRSNFMQDFASTFNHLQFCLA